MIVKTVEKPPAVVPSIVDWMLHPVRSYQAARWQKIAAWLDECQKGPPIFGGMDGMEFQKSMRDEWPD